MAKIEIKHRYTDAVLYMHETTDERVASWLATRDALEAACNRGADLSRANLSGADLSRAYLRGANLRGADLSRADLSRADLSGADLSRAYLRGANLRGADLSRADLSGADLSGANLSGANLSGANLSGANLSGAYLRGADLRGSKLVGDRPLLQIGPIGSRSDYLHAYITDAGVMIRAGCFYGTRDEFAAAVAKTHGDNVHGREYTAALALITEHVALWAPVTEVTA